MAGGHKSNGYTTERGRLTIVGAQTTNGSRCFSPVLPGIETQADWEHHLSGVEASLSPGSYLEKRFAFQIALTMRQVDRLNLYERASTIRTMEEGEDFHYGDESARRLVMEAGVHALKERAALATHIIELATVATAMAPDQPIAFSDGRLLSGLAFNSETKGKVASEPPFDEPPQWTWGAVQEGLAELARASGKPVEKILLAVCKQAAEQREEALEALQQGVAQLERCLVHSGTPLIHEYYSKVLGRLAKLLNLYGQAQAARLGLNIVEPLDAHHNGDNGDVSG
jgi:hypothetical protein